MYVLLEIILLKFGGGMLMNTKAIVLFQTHISFMIHPHSVSDKDE